MQVFSSQGGGVAIFVRNKWAASYVLNMDTLHDELEILWVQIPKYNLAIGAVYIPPGDEDHLCDRINELQNHIQTLQLKQLQCVIGGDFNIKLNEDSISASNMYNMLEANNLRIANNTLSQFTPTRIPEDGRSFQNPSILDYIVCSEVLDVREWMVDSDRQLSVHSDHVAIVTFIQLPRQEVEPAEEARNKVTWNRRKLKDKTLLERFKNELSINIGTEQSVQIRYDALHSTISNVGGQLFKSTIKEKKLSPREPIFIQKKKGYLRKLRKELRAHKRRGENTSRIDRDIWGVKREIRKCISTWSMNKLYTQLYRVNNRGRYGIQALYDTLHILKRRSNNKFLLRDMNGQPIVETYAIQAALFTQVDSIFCTKYWPNALPVVQCRDMQIDEPSKHYLVEDISEEEVRYAISQLNKGTSAGPTDIPPELICNLSDGLLTYMTDWCQSMWINEQVPHQLHYNDMVFLHKKGPTDNLKYYRTLATGCNMCKVFAKILTYRLQHVAEDNNLLGDIQTGFRQGRMGTENLFILETEIRITNSTGYY